MAGVLQRSGHCSLFILSDSFRWSAAAFAVIGFVEVIRQFIQALTFLHREAVDPLFGDLVQEFIHLRLEPGFHVDFQAILLNALLRRGWGIRIWIVGRS